MSCEVAALPFQAHANYGTWSKDIDYESWNYLHKTEMSKKFSICIHKVIYIFDSAFIYHIIKII